MHNALLRGVCLIAVLAFGVPAKADLQYDFRFSSAQADWPSSFGGTAFVSAFAFSLIAPAPFGSGAQMSADFQIYGYRVDDQGNPIPGTEMQAGLDSGIATGVPTSAPPSSLPVGVSPGDGCFEFPVGPPSPGGPGTGGYDNNCNLPGHGNYFALVRALFPVFPDAPGTYAGSSTFVWETLTGWGEGGSAAFGPSGQVSLTIFEHAPEPTSLALLLTLVGIAGASFRNKFQRRV